MCLITFVALESYSILPKNLTMSAAKGVLALQEEDLTKILVATAHLGSQNLNYQMEQYVFKRKNNGVCLFNVRKMWDKLVLAARAVAAVENPADVCVISARQIGQRATLKYARYTGKKTRIKVGLILVYG